MRDGWKIGRLFGIELTADWSWVFVFVLVTWSLSALFSAWNSDWPPSTSLLVACVAAISYFASVLAHALAHALVARAFDIRVRRIDLVPFGGVSTVEREPLSPRSEVLLALVGPLTNLVLGILILLLGTKPWHIDPIDGHPPWAPLSGRDPVFTILQWIGHTNIALATFHLIPGLPLAGGRLLRAALWSITRDQYSATRWASSVGQACGSLLVVLGIATVLGVRFPFFGYGFGGGLWLAFVGLSLNSAAAQGYCHVVVQSVLLEASVERVMRRAFMVTPTNASVSDAIDALRIQSHEPALRIMNDGHHAGIDSSGELIRIPRESWSTTPVSEIMTPSARLIVISPEDDLDVAIGKLAENDVEQLPVMADGQLVGMLDRRGLARWLEIQLDPTRPSERARAN